MVKNNGSSNYTVAVGVTGDTSSLTAEVNGSSIPFGTELTADSNVGVTAEFRYSKPTITAHPSDQTANFEAALLSPLRQAASLL